ncbi:MAG: Glu/Leu/Phe/Val dehydrogenase [Rhodospirillales bacterium]|nr:Glu/Leu/Phe/Val dehydrogenase [Rhodospirillales bacterium]MCB9996056.1 Glu/Leu/Phe/Val dehydrogenase [Rhodospirillales bacterium]
MGAAAADRDIQSKEEFFTILGELQERFEALKPELEVTVRDPALGVEGYVIVWNTGISKGGPLDGCGKGGTRITPNLSIDEVKMLSRTMALKNAAAGLPLGGAKSGMRADSSEDGFERKYRRFVKLCQPFLYENGGCFGGFGFDIGAQPVHAKWACDELGSTRSFTGKPVDMGGTDYDREGIAGLGVATAAKALIESRGEKADGMSFAVQGAGAMGAAVIRYFSEYGGQLKAMSDPKYDGCWAFDAGVSPALLKALVTQDVETAKSLVAQEGRHIGKDTQDVLFESVDVLFPCAIHNMITETNSYQIKARYISEGANQPVTKEAYPMLMEKGIHVIPDFIANPGGVIAAFVELTSQSDSKVEEAKSYTISKITDNVNKLMALVDRFGVEPVHAGQYLALSNIFYGIQD